MTACSDDKPATSPLETASESTEFGGADSLPPITEIAPAPPTSPSSVLPPAEAEPLACDPIDPSACLLPWPNDAFTATDPTTSTGRRLAIDATSPPKNADGVVVDVTDQ